MGGNVYIKGEIVKINDNHFKLEAGSDGDMVAAAGGPDGASVVLNGNTITVVPPGGAGITLLNSSLVGADLNAALNLIQVRGGSPCVNHPFASTDDKFISNGGSVSNGLDCASLDHLLDRFPVNLELEDEFPLRGVPGDASPAVDILDELIDRQQNQPGVSDLQDYAVSGDAIPLETLPCGYRDIRGLARPQDGDGDGIFGCDAGAYELQGGADIGAAQSGAYYDFAHSGEGIFVEVLTDGTVVVIWYTFDPLGNHMWILGTGTLEGNKVIIEARYPTGFTRFGALFDKNEIVMSDWGRFTLEFTGCHTLLFSYKSDIDAYGEGHYNYTRLTQLAGTGCPAS